LIVTSASIWLVALPLVIYRFHLVTPVALLINPLLWLPMAISLFAGFGVLLLGGVLPPIAGVCGWVCDVSLGGIESLIDAALLLPGGYLWIPSPPLWWVLAFYVGCVLKIGLAVKGRRLWLLRGMFVCWCLIGLAYVLGWAPLRGHRPPALRCTFVCVGHGTSVLVETPEGHKLLYDAGRQGTPRPAVRAVSATLWSRGLRRLDAVVLSHADTDHYNALPELLDRFSVGAVYVSPHMFRRTTPALATLREAVRESGTPVRELVAGQSLELVSQARCSALFPTREDTGGSDNANSLVLRIDYAGRTLLLPGDLESPGLDQLLAQNAVDCDLVMAPHHGSVHSHPRGFADWCRPEWVVISGGLRRDTSTVRRVFVETGAQVAHTAVDGAVRVMVSRDGLAVRTWRDAAW
jgi:competence protein ComEC